MVLSPIGTLVLRWSTSLSSYTLTIVTLHGRVDQGSRRDVKDIQLRRVPVIDLVEGEGLGGLTLACKIGTCACRLEAHDHEHLMKTIHVEAWECHEWRGFMQLMTHVWVVHALTLGVGQSYQALLLIHLNNHLPAQEIRIFEGSA